MYEDTPKKKSQFRVSEKLKEMYIVSMKQESMVQGLKKEKASIREVKD